jgi:hypothetical protein
MHVSATTHVVAAGRGCLCLPKPSMREKDRGRHSTRKNNRAERSPRTVWPLNSVAASLPLHANTSTAAVAPQQTAPGPLRRTDPC